MYDFMYPVDDDLESDVIAESAVPELYKRRKIEEQRLAQLEQMTKLYTQPLSEQLSALGRPTDLSYETNSEPIENDDLTQAGTVPYALSRQPAVNQPMPIVQQPVQQSPVQTVQPTAGATPSAQPTPVQSNGSKSLSAGVQQWRPLVTEIANKYGIDPEKALAIMQIESGGKAGITNQKGAPYGGLFQISTKIKGWNDPRINTETALKQMATRSNMFKKAYGREPSAGELYLMQQQGEGGAMALLNPKNANRPVEQVLAEVPEWKRRYGGDPNKVLNHVVKTNGGSAGMTAAQFASKWIGKANNVYGNSGTVEASNGNSKPTQVAQRKVLTSEAKPQSKKEYKRQVLNDEASNIKAQMDEIQKHMGLPNVNQATFNALQGRFKELKLTYDAINREKGSI